MAPKPVHVITGGAGYVGLNLAKKLIEGDAEVVLLDVNEPNDPLETNVTFIKGDIRNYDDVKKACENAACVYHLASYGMSGREQSVDHVCETVRILKS